MSCCFLWTLCLAVTWRSEVCQSRSSHSDLRQIQAYLAALCGCAKKTTKAYPGNCEALFEGVHFHRMLLVSLYFTWFSEQPAVQFPASPPEGKECPAWAMAEVMLRLFSLDPTVSLPQDVNDFGTFARFVACTQRIATQLCPELAELIIWLCSQSRSRLTPEVVARQMKSVVNFVWPLLRMMCLSF